MATARKAKSAAATEPSNTKAAPRRKPAPAAAKKPAAPSAGKAIASAEPAPGDQEIQRLAYELWEERGCPEGSGEEDWARAVEMLKA